MSNNKPPITQTGIKGFLIWYAREQPAIFAKIAPTLPAAVPKAFSNYNARFGNLQKFYRGMYKHRVGGQLAGASQRFGDYYSLAAPVAVNFESQLAAPISETAVSYTAVPTVEAGDLSTVNIPPVAMAANPGNVGTPVAAAIGQVVGAAANIYMTNNQAALQQSVVNTQLQRAAAGLPPLNTNLNSLGIPTVSTSGSIFSGSTILIGIAVALALAMSSGKKPA
jgi:hypothetical protein